MDASILHDRLAAAEKSIIQMDERLDGLDHSERLEDHDGAHIAHDERLTALEETLAGCIAHLERLEERLSSTLETTAEAEVEIARAEATEAVAEAIEALAEQETETAEENMQVEEIPLEPEPQESEAESPAKKPSANWLERLLALQ